MRPELAGPTTAADFLRDYAMSSLVLAADFRFKPVHGKDYYLYSTESGWKLSLIAPREWGQKSIGDFLARCQLRLNMTWELHIEDSDGGSLAAQRAQRFVMGFLKALSEQDSIVDSLPTYVEQLPYFRRLLASGLAASLASSLPSVGVAVGRLLADEQASSRVLGETARLELGKEQYSEGGAYGQSD